MSLNNFLNDTSFGGGSWADEVEDTIGTQPLPAPERPGMGSSSFGADRSFVRSSAPLPIPTRPPFTAHVGNLPYDATMEIIEEFFDGCGVQSVRIIEDREMQRPKGFAYVEFHEQDGLKKALDRDGEQINGRYVKVKVADSPRGGDFNRDLSDWTRKGPLTDLPDRGGDRRMGDFGDRRAPRDMEGGGPPRDFGNWERRGPLSPIAPEAPSMSREGSRARNDVRTGSMRERHQSPAWGEGRGDGSRPPYEARERTERAPTAAERDNAWRSSMKPDARAMSPALSRDGSEAPSSPAASSATPAGRPKLNLTKRTVPETTETPPAAASADSSKPNPFGAARPIDTRARERAIAERKEKELKEKQEAEEKAKEERRLAKEAAAKAEAEAAAEAAAKQEETAKAAEAAAAAEEAAPAAEAAKADEAGEKPADNGETKEQTLPVRAREPRPRADPNSRAAESGNWRATSAPRGAPSGPRRGGGRGGRNDGPRPQRNGSNQQQPPTPTAAEPAAPAAPAAPVQDEDGWTTVPNKGGRRQGRPVAS